MEKLDEEIREIFWTAVSGFIFAALILTAMGYAVARKILRPIEKMRELAQNISDKNLAQRVPAGKERDELSDFADTLNLMLDRLQLSFTKQKEFLFDTSHELKTPLSTMRLAVEDLCGSAEIIRMPEDKRQNLFRLENQILRMERLVKNLLDLSSFEALHSVKFNSISVAGLLQPLIDEYRFLAEANGIQMEADLPCGLTFQGDAEKMRRAFSNVLDNAVKYNSDAGDSLIRIKATGSRDAVTVVISNTGDAVPKDEFAKIFDQFYRVDKSRSLLKGGSGLGLAIVKKIAELHGGEVKFESVLDGQRNMNHLTMSFPNLKR
jgi:signal transduction histidine kinase